MSTITWIVIILIVISIAVTVSEVGLRFGILSKEKAGRDGIDLTGMDFTRADFTPQQLEGICGMPIVGTTFMDS